MQNVAPRRIDLLHCSIFPFFMSVVDDGRRAIRSRLKQKQSYRYSTLVGCICSRYFNCTHLFIQHTHNTLTHSIKNHTYKNMSPSFAHKNSTIEHINIYLPAVSIDVRPVSGRRSPGTGGLQYRC